jgi:hypothetical protein
MSTTTTRTTGIRIHLSEHLIPALERALKNEWAHIWTLREEAMDTGNVKEAAQCQELLDQLDRCMQTVNDGRACRVFWAALSEQVHSFKA